MISKSVVQTVLDACEIERFHALKLHLYPKLSDVFQQSSFFKNVARKGNLQILLIATTIQLFFAEAEILVCKELSNARSVLHYACQYQAPSQVVI